MKKTERAYLSGLFDGEGCISSRFPPSGIPTVLVQITQKNPEILYWVQTKTKMGIVKDNTNGTHAWRISHRDEIRKFIDLVYPFCIVKKDQLDIGLEFIALIGQRELHKEKRIELYHKLKELKHAHLS